ncbi:MAG: LOG family protein [Nitrospinales bacterium]
MNNYNRQYKVGDPKAEKLIRELVEFCSPGENDEMLREILTTVVKLGREHKDVGDYKLINTALKELRHAMRIFVPYRETRKAVIFGSSRTEKTDPRYLMARELAQRLVQNDFMVITGAGGGIMEAANLGATKEKSFGINIKFPSEQKANPYIKGDPKLMTFKYFFTRKLFFIKESDATVLFPGGFGTLDEGFENLTLFQTGKCMIRPIVLVEPAGENYWEHWIACFRDELLQKQFISPDDLKLFYHARSVEDAAAYIVGYYRVFHSLRYVRKLTVLRFTRGISSSLLDRLNREYGDILREGKIEASPPLKDEVQRKEYLQLPRLVLNFNKQNFGRLNEMICEINRSAD